MYMYMICIHVVLFRCGDKWVSHDEQEENASFRKMLVYTATRPYALFAMISETDVISIMINATDSYLNPFLTSAQREYNCKTQKQN